MQSLLLRRVELIAKEDLLLLHKFAGSEGAVQWHCTVLCSMVMQKLADPVLVAGCL